MTTPDLPPRFPCWVKAVYSWGGESKRDLGFVEGDLIECLNAGDGSWWMGRLRRDRRMVGLFPSNFVKVLDDSFQPTPRLASLNTPTRRTGSPSQGVSPHGSATNSPTPTKPKSVFRKPFTAYAAAGAPNPAAAARDLAGATPSPAGSISKTSKRAPYASMKRPQNASPSPAPTPKRAPSPTIPAPIPRGSSPLPQSDFGRSSSRGISNHIQRPVSRNDSHLIQQRPVSRNNSHLMQRPASRAAPHPLPQPISRATSPSPQFSESRSASRTGYYSLEGTSPPPPPPPAHRIAFTSNDWEEPAYSGYNEYPPEQQYEHGYNTPRHHSPAPSDQPDGLTPSPLRDAMVDVMNSLDGMSLSRSNSCAQQTDPPPNIWSPDAFDEIYSESANRVQLQRSSTKQFDRIYAQDDHTMASNRHNLNDYVQRMENRLDGDPHNSKNIDHSYENEVSSSPPLPPPKGSHTASRPATSHQQTAHWSTHSTGIGHEKYFGSSIERPESDISQKQIRARKSAYELGKEKIYRTLSTKTSVTTASSSAQSTSTNQSNSTQATSQSLMSGHSAGGFSATSAGSLARRKWGSMKGRPASAMDVIRPDTSTSSVSYHSSHASGPTSSNEYKPHVGCEPIEWSNMSDVEAGPRKKKSGFFRKMIDTAKTSAATARSTVSSGQSSRPVSRHGSVYSKAITGIEGGPVASSAAAEMGLGGSNNWVQMRRDVNRSNSLSKNERNERAERCQMMDMLVMSPAEILEQAEGNEDAYGNPVQSPVDFANCNLALVDKNARFINSLPALINAASLAQGYLCRPYRGHVQRLRAIFTWIAERISWEEDFEGDIDTRRVLQTRRGCSEEIAILVAEMCFAVGVHAEVIRGYLKRPGESLKQNLRDTAAHPNHWWNAVIVDGEWRIMDCSLAGPTNPHRSMYSTAGAAMAEGWWFLAQPMEICYTHVPLLPEQQHIVPSLPHEVLMALPVANPACFKNNIRLWDYDTSMLQLDGLEMAHIRLSVPVDVECVAEVEARAFARDLDGDLFESGEVVRKAAIAQGEFVSCDGTVLKRYTLKALLPGSSDASSSANSGSLKIYAGPRGLMHGVNKNPHSLALVLPLSHQGTNPEYDFFTRHPTPHALRHELYIIGPLCKRLVYNSTFVFGVRQHPASNSAVVDASEQRALGGPSRPTSSMSMGRPMSALSMASVSVSGSSYSIPSATGSDQSQSQDKPAKLAIQSPSGKIMRMTRKMEQRGRLESQDDGVVRLGSMWETIIKIGEKGVWRGLVLADRSARWCVFGEWECV